jgi:hypothetical protein
MAEGLDEFPFGPIARDLREGNCIAFLGAGASSFPDDIAAKPPSARALAMELAEEWRYPQYQVFCDTANSKKPVDQERRLRARLDCKNLVLVSSWVEHGLGDRPHLRNTLRAHLANVKQPLPYNPLHDLLARMAQKKPMAIITTNYDDLIELALLERKVAFDLFVVAIDRPAAEARVEGATLFRPAGQDDLKPVEARVQGATLFRPAGHEEFIPVTGEHQLLQIKDDGEEVRLERTALFKIHGHIGRTRRTDDTFVITEEDYVSFLGRMGSGNSVIPADLVNLMQSRTLLFLAYGLRDWNFRVLFDRLTGMRLQAIRSFAIAYDIDPAEGRLWDQRNVKVFSADLNKFVPLLDEAWKKMPPRST